jgi:hypothetical protein
MSIHRSYFEKQATLINNNPTNNSRNPVVELSFGGGNTVYDKKNSRYIFKPDLTALAAKVDKEEIRVEQMESHTLHLKNVINLASDLIAGDYLDAKRASGVEIILYELSEDFEEGTGYEYVYNTNFSTPINPSLNAPNWEYKANNEKWKERGSFTKQPAIIARQKLLMGNEDISFDVTFYINCVLLGSKENKGLGIAFAPEFEKTVDDTRYSVTFFSKYTNTFFEPYLETEYNQVINDDRTRFYLDEPNQLHLVSNKSIDYVEQVDIYDMNDNLVKSFTGEEVIKIKNNAYKINIELSSDDFPDLVNFRDIWFYSVNGKGKSHVQTFTLSERDLFNANSSLQGKEFWFSFSGIKQNDVISSKSGKKVISVNTKRLHNSSVVSQPDIDGLEYRVYTTQGREQLEVIPYTSVDKLSNTYSFMVDFSWFIPHHYYLEMRIKHNDIEYKSNQIVNFRVVS